MPLHHAEACDLPARPAILIAWVLMLGFVPASVAVAQPLNGRPGPDPAPWARETGPTAAELAGRCVALQLERRRLQAERESMMGPVVERNSQIDAMLAVLSMPGARPAEAASQRGRAEEARLQIEQLRAVLAGEPSSAWADRPVAEVRQRIDELAASRRRSLALARAHDATGHDRVELAADLKDQKLRLMAQIDLLSEAFASRLDRLNQTAQAQRDAMESAMARFGLLARLGDLRVEAVRIGAVVQDGRLTLTWTDRQGLMVASAHLWLRVRPDADPAPPFVHGRYPVLLQNRQEAQISAGYFLIEFRVSRDELSGEARVLETAARLLDIDGLGRLVPRLGDDGLD